MELCSARTEEASRQGSRRKSSCSDCFLQQPPPHPGPAERRSGGPELGPAKEVAEEVGSGVEDDEEVGKDDDGGDPGQRAEDVQPCSAQKSTMGKWRRKGGGGTAEALHNVEGHGERAADEELGGDHGEEGGAALALPPSGLGAGGGMRPAGGEIRMCMGDQGGKWAVRGLATPATAFELGRRHAATVSVSDKEVGRVARTQLLHLDPGLPVSQTSPSSSTKPMGVGRRDRKWARSMRVRTSKTRKGTRE